jgi:hemerythrin
MNGRSLLLSIDNHMIEWNDKYSVNISLIDEQHKKLFKIINKAIIANKHSIVTKAKKQLEKFIMEGFMSKEAMSSKEKNLHV